MKGHMRFGLGNGAARRAGPLLLALGVALPWVATAAPAPEQTGGQDAVFQQDLYQDALQSIAEGRRNDASNELRRLLEREPMHAGAWLDLAMTQCAIGHGDEAERLFAFIETHFLSDPANPHPGMLQLIAETREAGCSRWRPQTSISITAGRGIDQNVNQGASRSNYVLDTPAGPVEYALSSDFLPQHDAYTMLATDTMRELTPNGLVGFAQLLARHNDRLHRYDSTALYAGVEAPWRFGRWTLHATGALGAVTLGGHDYQHQAQLQARIGPPLPLPQGAQFHLVLGVTHTAFQTLQNFDSDTYEARGLFVWRRQDRFASASLGRLNDRAGELRPGGARSGWYGNLVLRRTLAASLTGELAWTGQTWHGSQVYSAGVIDTVRHQVTQTLRGTLSYPLNRNQTLQLEGRLIRNQENVSVFQYRSRQLQLSWQWQY